MNIIVTGSLAFDQIMDFPGKFSDSIMPEKIHQINLSFLVDKLIKQRGGTAGNIAYNLALLGLKPTILATAGHDFGEYKKDLEKAGVDVSMIRIIEIEPTASAFIFTDQADNQITGFYPGAMKEAGIHDRMWEVRNGKLDTDVGSEKNRNLTSKSLISESNFSLLTSHFGKEIFVVISPNDPSAMVNFVKECIKYKIPYLFDPGMQLPRLSDADLKLGVEGAKIVIGNDYEMSLMTKRLNYCSSEARTTAMNFSLRSKNKDQLWITTLGEKGARIEVGDTIYSIPPAKPKAVLDPTGAGDAFRAGFLAGFLSGQPLEICGRMGSVASVYTVEKYGTQTHKFTKKEFQKRYEENFKQEMGIRDFVYE